MVSQSAKCVFGLLAITLLAGGGCCTNWYLAPDQCACGLSEFDLGCAVDWLCSGESLKGCGWPVDSDCTPNSTDCPSDCTDCQVCQPTCVLGCQQRADLCLNFKWRPGRNVQSGPPPVSYRPPMPPEFLPVPTQPIFAAVNLAAPEPTRGKVEVDFGTQLVVPGRN